MVAPTMIKEHMEVLGADGVHVGTVDQLEGRDSLRVNVVELGCLAPTNSDAAQCPPANIVGHAMTRGSARERRPALEVVVNRLRKDAFSAIYCFRCNACRPGRCMSNRTAKLPRTSGRGRAV